ncbi:MAG: carbon-nitrogen hydrolase family protein [Rhodospirillaceae bacterium]|nr:carbon-nitrogen hydrolase family protein [Rhodospirillaceae bacterium]MXW90412.1 carbon-nitrogen hydrolase family protein [Rhodospirillaceae bacterium]MYB11730.1 carbon-nitrogen hydrolase family protein [Rhodospirillaceae bacterium]MYI47886.1 carbon-nitrogen hydrolase family protein [Rhodospirillaceae bacterium]
MASGTDGGRRVKVACLQVTAGREFDPNIRKLCRMIRTCAEEGAKFVLTPENATMIEPVAAAAVRKAKTEEDHPALPALTEAARKAGVWLLIGSLSIRLPGGKLANRSFLVDDDGAVVARYDKLHCFDVNLREGERYRESDTIQAGSEAVLAPSPWGRIGMTVCYDLRFPGLYRTLAQAGADILTIPSAFTRTTGKAHWHTLLRARAIETGCFVIAPAQWGDHAEGRKTYGHSLIVDPWGETVADGGEGESPVFGTLDLDLVEKSRRRIPSLHSERAFTVNDLTVRRDAAE